MEHSMGLKRAAAYLIDAWICGAILAVCMMPFMLYGFFQEPMPMYLRPGILSMGWVLALSCGVFLLYGGAGDLLGGTVGKRVVGIRIVGDDGPVKSLGFALKHGLIKIVLSLIWPVSGIYCLTRNGHLFYDRWLKVVLVDIRNQ